MGEDGHTASLFPGAGELNDTRHAVVPVVPAGKTARVSLTLPALNNAENIIFLVTGKSKATVVRDVIESEIDSLPAARIIPEKGKVFFFLDNDAGSLLFRTDRKP